MPYTNAQDSIKDLKNRYQRTTQQMRAVMDRAEGRKLTASEADEWDRLKRQSENIYETIQVRRRHKEVAKAGKNFPAGRANEPLKRSQSFVDWHRAHGSYESRAMPTEYDYESYWSQRLGFSKPGAEIRNDPFAPETRTVYGLGEDTSSGSGAGADIVGQLWGHQVVDLIRAKTFTGRLGATTVPLATEITNVPLWASDVAPAYVPEQTAMSLDITPSTSVLQMVAATYADVTGATLSVLEDAVNTGGVNDLIQNSIAQKYSRLCDTLALYGGSGTPANSVPGLVNESILTQSMGTNGAAPTSYKDISKAAAQVREQNVEPNGVVWHPGTYAEYSELVDTLGQPMRPTPDVAGLNFVDSGLLNFQTETQGTGTTCSSLYVGDWSYLRIGFRTEGVEVMKLDQRWADYLMVGFLSRLRLSIRVVHPTQTFCRLEGIL
jgi:HK97 family phage major capsid protein